MSRATDKHTSLQNWELDERVRDQLLGTGLEFFHDLVKDNARYLHDSRFHDALKRFYDEETYCFNLGEDKRLFFGADSILLLTGLKFSGSVVRKKDGNPLGETDGGKTFVDGLGWIDTKFIVNKSIKLEGLKKFMKVGDQNLEHCVNAYILFLVGTVIVATSARKMPLTYLNCIKNGMFKEHAWGLALLSNMHHYLREEKQDQKYNSACKYLFMLFFFEHLPGLRDAFFTEDGDLIFSETDSLPAEFPLSLSWAPYVQRILRNRRNPLEIDYISVMANSEITWNVCKRLGENFLPMNIRGDFEMRFYRGPLIHPLHNSKKDYQHRPDYCPRHFGVDYVVYEHCPRIVLPYKGVTLMEEQWRNWKNCLIRLPALGHRGSPISHVHHVVHEDVPAAISATPAVHKTIHDGVVAAAPVVHKAIHDGVISAALTVGAVAATIL